LNTNGKEKDTAKPMFIFLVPPPILAKTQKEFKPTTEKIICNFVVYSTRIAYFKENCQGDIED